jgi:hypothetical protein
MLRCSTGLVVALCLFWVLAVPSLVTMAAWCLAARPAHPSVPLCQLPTTLTYTTPRGPRREEKRRALKHTNPPKAQ